MAGKAQVRDKPAHPCTKPAADSPFAGEPKALTRVGGPPTDPAYLWLPSAYRSGEKSFGLDTEILQIALWLARTLWVVGACAVMLASDIPAIVSPSLDCSAVACLALNPLFLVPCIEHCVACASIELHASCRAFCTCAGHLTTESCASFSRTRQHSTTHSKGANSDPGVTVILREMHVFQGKRRLKREYEHVADSASQLG